MLLVDITFMACLLITIVLFTAFVIHTILSMKLSTECDLFTSHVERLEYQTAIAFGDILK